MEVGRTTTEVGRLWVQYSGSRKTITCKAERHGCGRPILSSRLRRKHDQTIDESSEHSMEAECFTRHDGSSRDV